MEACRFLSLHAPHVLVHNVALEHATWWDATNSFTGRRGTEIFQEEPATTWWFPRDQRRPRWVRRRPRPFQRPRSRSEEDDFDADIGDEDDGEVLNEDDGDEDAVPVAAAPVTKRLRQRPRRPRREAPVKHVVAAAPVPGPPAAGAAMMPRKCGDRAHASSLHL